MIRLLDMLARLATRVPTLTLAVLVAATVGFGTLSSQLQVDTGVEGFAPEGGLADVQDEIEERFATGSAVQVLIDSGAGGNVLSRDTIIAVAALADRLTTDPHIAPALAPQRTGRPAVVSFATPFTEAVSDGGTSDDTFATLPPPMATVVIDRVVDEASDEIAALLSTDFDPGAVTSRSGLLQVGFSGDVADDVAERAAARVEQIVSTTEIAGVRTGVLSTLAIEEAVADSLARDLPRLLTASFVLVLFILALLFRSIADVLVGFFGLLASIIWMLGIAVLLGPDYAGVVGDFSQIGIAIPVLLVGLGIDYSVHLTSRYREEQARGASPERAARTALTTVGFALVLATIAAVAGFLANMATPLPPIRDFGILAAVGIVAAFVILGGAVPATRVMIDRRRTRRPHAQSVDRNRSTDPWWVRSAVVVATRAPIVALSVATALLVGGGILATGLSTEFDDRDFLPSGAPLTALIDRLDTQFDGEVGERTVVLVDGDTDDGNLIAAAAQFEEDLASLEQVRTLGDRPDVLSPFFFVEMIADEGERTRQRLADQFDAWSDPVGVAADVQLPETIDGSLIDDPDALDIPADLEDAVGTRLPDGESVVDALITTMDPDELDAEIRAAIAESSREDRPESLDADTLTRLATIPADRLTRDVLQEAGYFWQLDGDTRQALARVEQLEHAGWPGERPRDPEDWAALIATANAIAPDDLRGVIDSRGMVIDVATSAGQDAEALADQLVARGTSVRAVGGDITVVSDALIQAQIISSLASAQLQAIAISLAAAAVLLVAASLFTSRNIALGLIGIVPSAVALVLVLGAMRLAGIAFNALTATVASIAVGIGVPYGIHLTNRFREAWRQVATPEAAIRDTLANTGPALVGSAVTTGLAFAVLVASESIPVVQFGRVSFLMIGFALAACVFVQPSLLVLWARHHHEPHDR
ncbi:MAG: MMPL family transporter [Nitriliruptoraceae bacterium]